LAHVGKVECWNPKLHQWTIWIQAPDESEPTLWMFDD
jgi:hypothetical protein